MGPSVELQNGLSILNNTRGEQGLMENIKPWCLCRDNKSAVHQSDALSGAKAAVE